MGIWVLLVTICFTAFAQSPILDQAIQVVRNWLGDPQAEVYFVHDVTTVEDLFGSRNEYVFNTKDYIFSVNIDTMKITSWSPNLTHYMKIVQTDLPLLNDDQLKEIAITYAKQHFLHWNEYPNWEVVSVFKARLRDLDGKKIAWFCSIEVRPYFLNEQGMKIPFLATRCDVRIDPYSGNVVGFGYDYTPMTVTDLKPAFSSEEAKRRVEQAFLNMGAAQASAVWSATGFPYEDLPDGLVLGATQTSGLRLAYAFDYVLTVGTPETEDEFGTPQMPAKFRAAIDAHTGELFFYEALPGRMQAGERDKHLLEQGLKKILNQPKRDTIAINIGLVIVVGLLVIFLFLRRFLF